jgi:acetyl-CoA acetyltransferase
MFPTDVVILSGARTPMARYNGAFKDITNVNGGAIALGHSLAASGTRLVITLLNELRRNNLRYGLATACIGGGQGIAMIVEALPRYRSAGKVVRRST